MKKNLSLLAIIVLAVFACSKQDNGKSKLKSQSLGNRQDLLQGSCPYPCTDTRCKAYINGYCGTPTDTIAIIKNSNNPYDYVGSQHNQGVKSIFPTVSSSIKNLDSVVLVKVKSYETTIGYSATAMQTFYNNTVQQGYFPFSNLPRLDSLGNKMKVNNLISSYANTYVQQIYGYANQYLNTDTISNAKYTSFCNSLINLESTIKNDTRISSSEKQALLSSCSTARYSASYWGNYLSGGGGSNSNTMSNVRPLLFGKLSAWWRVVISDAGGALVGIAAGPVGIVGGAIGTSIVTAVTVS